MDWLHTLIDLFIHLDRHLAEIIADYGAWTYLVLFLVIFCETGLVVTPLLPGDSLLFAIGTFAAAGSFDPLLITGLLMVAAVLGDAVNYALGAYLGPKVFCREGSRFFKKEHLDRTRRFYERHGGKTIILARFVPIIRTFAPFVAGVGRMPYPCFFAYNLVGGVTWVAIFIGAGYAFGNIPAVRENFTFVALGIVFVSLLPVGFEWLKSRRRPAAPVESCEPAAVAADSSSGAS